MALLERGRSHVHRPPNHRGLGLDVELVAEIDDEHGLAGRSFASSSSGLIRAMRNWRRRAGGESP